MVYPEVNLEAYLVRRFNPSHSSACSFSQHNGNQTVHSAFSFYVSASSFSVCLFYISPFLVCLRLSVSLRLFVCVCLSLSLALCPSVLIIFKAPREKESNCGLLRNIDLQKGYITVYESGPDSKERKPCPICIASTNHRLLINSVTRLSYPALYFPFLDR